MELNNWHNWNPENYLEDYHTEVAIDTKYILEYLVEFFNENLENINKLAILDFGCGPTLYGILSIGHHFKEIYLADYLSSNLTQIDKWIKRYKDTFNWNSHTEFVLQINQTRRPSRKQIFKREDELRTKIKSLLTCDAYKPDPLGKFFRQKFSLVITLFCADSIVSSKEDWKLLLKNIFSLVAPEGFFVVGSLLECTSYKVGNDAFPSANISSDDFKEVVVNKLDIILESLSIKVFDVPECKSLGYTNILLASMQKKK